MASQKPTEYLTEEHEAIKKMLKIVDKVSLKLESGEEVSPDHLEKIVYFIRGFADKCHYAKEEDLLFPAMIDSGVPEEGGPINLLGRHIDKEDNILCQIAEMHISEEGMAKLWEEFERVEREKIGPGKHEAFMAILNELEAEYLEKSE